MRYFDKRAMLDRCLKVNLQKKLFSLAINKVNRNSESDCFYKQNEEN